MGSTGRRPWIRDHPTAVTVGVVLTVAGTLCLYDAYERRGRDKPFWLRFLPV